MVDRTPCKDWTMCDLIVSTAHGKYFSALEYVSPGHVSKFPFFISLSHMDLTGNPNAACMYRTSASTLGRSYALYDERVVCLFVVWCSSNSLVGFRAKRHSVGSYFSLQPVRIGLLLGKNTVTSCLVNNTVQSASHMAPTPTGVLVKDDIMYRVVGKYATNGGIGSVAVADKLSTCTVAVPTILYEALVLGGPIRI